MIDTITLVGTLKGLEMGDLKRLEQVALMTERGTKFRPYKNYLESPLSRAEIQMKLLHRRTERSGDLLEAWMKIPVASALIGQNYLHGGPECFLSERGLLAKLIRVLLEGRGFSEQEVDRFFRTTRTELVELTWHTETASQRAAKNLQTRTLDFLSRLEELHRFHDCQVAVVDRRTRQRRTGHLTTLKDGRQFRQYLKAEHMAVERRREWKVSAANAENRPDRGEIRALLASHVRNEVRLGEKYLRGRGHLNPGTWTPEVMVSFIEETFAALRFTGTPVEKNFSALEACDRTILERRLRGDDLSDLAPHVRTRVRQRLHANGYEIGFEGRDLAYTANFGKQLDFNRRWIVPENFRRFIVCDETYDKIKAQLDQELALARAYFTPERLMQMEAERIGSSWLVTRRRPIEQSRLAPPNGSIGSSPA